MKKHEAKQELNHVLENQKTISVPKLNRLLEHSYIAEVEFLKKEIRRLSSKVRRQKKANRRLVEDLESLKKKVVD